MQIFYCSDKIVVMSGTNMCYNQLIEQIKRLMEYPTINLFVKYNNRPNLVFPLFMDAQSLLFYHTDCSVIEYIFP